MLFEAMILMKNETQLGGKKSKPTTTTWFTMKWQNFDYQFHFHADRVTD
jgi:hypothetical protein